MPGWGAGRLWRRVARRLGLARRGVAWPGDADAQLYLPEVRPTREASRGRRLVRRGTPKHVPRRDAFHDRSPPPPNQSSAGRKRVCLAIRRRARQPLTDLIDMLCWCADFGYFW